MANAAAATAPKPRSFPSRGRGQPYVSLLTPRRLQLLAVAIAREGHWFTGTAVIIAAYGASLLLADGLFRKVKAKLPKLHWFARLRSSLIVGSIQADDPASERKLTKLDRAMGQNRNGLTETDILPPGVFSTVKSTCFCAVASSTVVDNSPLQVTTRLSLLFEFVLISSLNLYNAPCLAVSHIADFSASVPALLTLALTEFEFLAA
ncbi:hypothetical protein [Bradyrhizobium sp. ARR65]|uniref:hypothetical protein n=1 Tax=Bradyrhizobium sp. ARR65 TaxID=1040989 RepID=UPI0012FA0842|nr:hypothetical protein [Bradyrhizobium sp. ARR65]